MRHSQLLSRAVLDIPAIARDAEDRRVSNELLDDINAGRAKITAIVENERLVGSLVYEIRGRTLIVHALRCDNITADCTRIAETVARQVAHAHNCNAIHCDTKRPGLVAKLVELGWHVSAVSLRLAV